MNVFTLVKILEIRVHRSSAKLHRPLPFSMTTSVGWRGETFCMGNCRYLIKETLPSLPHVDISYTSIKQEYPLLLKKKRDKNSINNNKMFTYIDLELHMENTSTLRKHGCNFLEAEFCYQVSRLVDYMNCKENFIYLGNILE